MKTQEANTSARRSGAVRAATVFVVVAGCCLVATLPGQMPSDNTASSSGVYAQAVDISTKDRAPEHREYERDLNVSGKALVALGSNGFNRSTGPGSLATGFEAAEGFVPGAIFGQVGWGAFQTAPEGHIDNVNPAAGSQHLRVSKDASLPTGTNVGAFTPDLGPLLAGSSTTSVDVAISATGGADYFVVGQSNSEQLLTWEVDFGFLGTILVVDDIGAGLVFVDTGVVWAVGPYQNLTVCDDPVAGSTDYYYNGALIYSQVTHLSGTRVEQAVLFSDNWQASDNGDFDNLTIQPGLSGICGGCAPGGPGEIVLNAGDDGWSTGDGGAEFTFGDPFGDLPGEPPIPADFFGPGSDPFEGLVEFRGVPFLVDPAHPDASSLGGTDTIVRRNECTVPLGIGASDTIEIEIVALSLESTQPITVTFNGGQDPTLYDVNLCLSSQSPQCLGSMTITRDGDFGGTLTSSFPVIPKFTFEGPFGPFELDLGEVPVDCLDPPLVVSSPAGEPNSWAVVDEVGGPTRGDFGINSWPAGIEFNANCGTTTVFGAADPTNVTTAGTSKFQGGLDTGGSVPDSCPPPDARNYSGPPEVKCKKTKEGCEVFATGVQPGSHSAFISSDADDNDDGVPDVCQGECCLPDGSCTVDDEESCCDEGGTFSGNGTKCDPDGACCMPDGTCVQDTTKKCCELAGGEYMGDGTTTCPVPPCALPPPDPHATWSDGTPGLNDATFGSKTNPPIPADFFGPGSDPFVGTIPFRGFHIDDLTDIGTASAFVQRLGPVPQPSDPVGTVATIPIEIVALSLVSTEPITVTFNGGQNPELWDVAVALSDISSITDLDPEFTITKTHANGGTFDVVLFVQPKFTFTRVENPSEVQIFDTGLNGIPPVQLQAGNVPFVHSVNPDLHLISPSDGTFVPGVEETVPGDPESQQVVPATLTDPVAGVTHTVCPPRPPDPHKSEPGLSVSSTNFGNDLIPPISADFFGPGSDPFTGDIAMEGVALDPADPETSTLIARQADPIQPSEPIGTERTIEVEIVALSLKSIAPITVTFNGGQSPEEWDVKVALSDVPVAPGSLTATKTHDNGGTYNMSLLVSTKLTFTKTDGTEVQVLDTALEGIDPIGLTTLTPVPWVHKLDAGLEGKIQAPFDGVFVPGVQEGAPSGARGPGQTEFISTLGNVFAQTFHSVKPPVPPVPPVPPDPHATVGDGLTSVQFGTDDAPAIPADFFGPGSPPFAGTIPFESASPDSVVDTLVQRSGPVVFPGAGFPRPSDAIPLEIIELTLTSADPITVSGTIWSVDLELSDAASPPPGTLQATLLDPNSGDYDATIPVLPKFTFTNVDEPTDVRTLDFGVEGLDPILIEFVGAPFVINLTHELEDAIIVSSNGNFVPGVLEKAPGVQLVVELTGTSDGGGVEHTVKPPPKKCEVLTFNVPKDLTACTTTSPFGVDFKMEATFKNACECCEYRQYVKGELKRNKRVVPFQLGPGEKLEKDNFNEDCLRNPGTSNTYYGHRDEAKNTIASTSDEYTNPNDRKTGCNYDGVDTPQMPARAGVSVRLNVTFRGQIIDTCDGNAIKKTTEWDVDCSGTGTRDTGEQGDPVPLIERFEDVVLAGTDMILSAIVYSDDVLVLTASIDNGRGSLPPIDASEVDVQLDGFVPFEVPSAGPLPEVRLRGVIAVAMSLYPYPPGSPSSITGTLTFRGAPHPFSFLLRSVVTPPLLPGIIGGVDHDIAKQRFLSINPNNATASTRMRLSLLDNGCSVTGKQCVDDASCTVCDAASPNAGVPCDKDTQCGGPANFCVVSGETCEELSPPVVLGFILDPKFAGGDAPPNTVIAAVDPVDPGFRVWNEPLVHIVDCEVAPSRVYRVEVESPALPGVFAALDIRTSPTPEGKDWGDIVGSFDGTTWSAGNLLVGVDDVSAIIKFLTLKPAPHVTVCEMLSAVGPTYVNMDVSADELGQVIRCFQGELYPPLPMVLGGYPDLNDIVVPPAGVETLLDCPPN